MEKLNKEYIKLDQFLKMSNIISTGGEAKIYLMENKVLVNALKKIVEVENYILVTQ